MGFSKFVKITCTLLLATLMIIMVQVIHIGRVVTLTGESSLFSLGPQFYADW